MSERTIQSTAVPSDQSAREPEALDELVERFMCAMETYSGNKRGYLGMMIVDRDDVHEAIMRVGGRAALREPASHTGLRNDQHTGGRASERSPRDENTRNSSEPAASPAGEPDAWLVEVMQGSQWWKVGYTAYTQRAEAERVMADMREDFPTTPYRIVGLVRTPNAAPTDAREPADVERIEGWAKDRGDESAYLFRYLFAPGDPENEFDGMPVSERGDTVRATLLIHRAPDRGKP